jgi:hypothetical protein
MKRALKRLGLYHRVNGEDKIIDLNDELTYPLNTRFYIPNGCTAISGRTSHKPRNSFNLYGDASDIHGNAYNIWGNVSGLKGNVSFCSGDITNVIGDISGIMGDFTNVSGDFDQCEITNEERFYGIRIEDLIILEKLNEI